jgi:hypothetical protein
MTEIVEAALVLLILLGASGIGRVLRHSLPERHRSSEAIELVRLVVAMLVTFAALVLGLLTTSVKSSFDTVSNDLRALAVDVIRLDRSLAEYGTETEPTRALLRSYTAAVIASTWTGEPRPAGDYYPKQLPKRASAAQLENAALGDMLTGMERDIRGLEPRDAMHRRLAADCLNRLERLMQRRWKLIEEAHSSISTPFYTVLVFWLAIVFASLGLIAPRSALAYAAIAIGGVSIASAVFVILDLDTPFEGIFMVSSHPMRDALAHLGG